MRVDYFQWMRAMGAMGIVFLHVVTSVTANVDFAAVGEFRAVAWAWSSTVLGRWAVPCFAMVTGALLLNPQKDLPLAKVGRYIRRMVLVICTFGLLFCLMESVYTYRALTLAALGEAVLNMASGMSWDHMWYVYALVGLYLASPFVKAFTDKASKSDLKTVVGVLFLLAVAIPTVNDLLGLELFTLVFSTSWAEFSTSLLFYFVLGHYLHRYMDLDAGVAAAGAAGLATSLAGSAWLIHETQDFCVWFQAPSNVCICLYSSLVFLLFKRLLDRPVKGCRAMALVADYSFGIYIVHPVFLNVLYRMCGWFESSPLPPGLFEIVTWAAVLVAAVATVWAVRRIPGIKTLV